jgi:hypothetical protein
METNQLMTMAEAMQIQAEHLSIWFKVLNKETYNAIMHEVNHRNAKGYDSPYDVFRGQSIDNWVINYAIRLP